MFGPEDNGLSNEDILLCTHLMRIPSSTKYASLNLAQAVMVCCYELYVVSGLWEPVVERSAEAPSAMRERMYDLWREALLTIGFMEEDKADHMMLGLKRVLGRGLLTEKDIRILTGIARQTRWAGDELRKVKGKAATNRDPLPFPLSSGENTASEEAESFFYVWSPNGATI